MSRMLEKALYRRIPKEIHCAAAIVIISGRKQGTLSFEISNQKTLTNKCVRNSVRSKCSDFKLNINYINVNKN